MTQRPMTGSKVKIITIFAVLFGMKKLNKKTIDGMVRTKMIATSLARSLEKRSIGNNAFRRPRGKIADAIAMHFSASVFITSKASRPTVELTRRREFNQASPHELSYETRSR